MSTYYKNKRTNKIIEYPPYKCKICGQYDIAFPHDICSVCGWEDDSLENENKNDYGGANKLTFNQYKSVWEHNKNDLMKKFPNGLGVYMEILKIFKSAHNKYGGCTLDQLEMLNKIK